MHAIEIACTQFAHEKILRHRSIVAAITQAQAVAADKTTLFIKCAVSFKANRTIAKRRHPRNCFVKQSFAKSLSLPRRRNADRPQAKHRQCAASVQKSLRRHAQALPNEGAIPFHHQIKRRLVALGFTQHMDQIMLNRTWSIHIPKRIAH